MGCSSFPKVEMQLPAPGGGDCLSSCWEQGEEKLDPLPSLAFCFPLAPKQPGEVYERGTPGMAARYGNHTAE